MRETVIGRINARFETYEELLDGMSEPVLHQTTPLPKSKPMSEHLWCIVGSRESYTRALEAGKWSGFDCSLRRVDKAELAEALGAAADRFNQVVSGVSDWTADRERLLLDLLEHEVMHEGQIIRHMYGLGHSLPKSIQWA